MVARVSVIMPVHNQDRHIAEAVKSVLHQTLREWELVVVDDGSTDTTAEVVARFRDPRIRYVHQAHHGVSHARNVGVSRSSGEYLAFLDSDDRYHPDKLKVHVDHLDGAPSLGMSYGPHIRIDEAGEPWSFRWPPETVGLKELVLGFPCLTSATVVRRDWHDRVGGFDASFVINEDREYFVRLALAGCEMARAGGYLTEYRVYAGRRIDDLPGKLADMLRALAAAFDNPRCPPEVRALHERAHRAIYLEWAYQAALAGASQLVRTYFREAHRFGPFDSRPSLDSLLQAWVEAATRNRGDHETRLRAVFSELPAEWQHLSIYDDWALACADVLRSVREAIWGRTAEALASLRRGIGRAVPLDERMLWLLKYDLQNAGSGLGVCVPRRALRLLSPYLRSMKGGRRGVRWLENRLLAIGIDGPPLRIAFLVNGFPLLSETFILNQVTGLLDRGHDVKVFVRSSRKEPKVHEVVERYRLSDRTHTLLVDAHSVRYRLLYLAKTTYLLIKNLRRYPRVVSSSLGRFNPLRVRESVIALHPTAVMLDEGPFDVVHAHFGPNGNWALRLRQAGAFGAKVVTTFHTGFDLSVQIEDRGQHVYDELFERGDLFMAISDTVKDQLMGVGCPEHKIVVHHVGVDVRFNVAEREAPVGGRIRLTSVARLVERKGIEYGVEAVATLSGRYDHLEYTIAGDGPARADLEALIDSLGAEGVVRLRGWQSQGEITALLRRTDVFLAPSVTGGDGAQEGIPTALMEAMAYGIPVVSTRHSGIPELVHHGASGLLVPERDSAALVEGLDRLIRDSDLRVEMGRKGRSHVEAHFNIETQNDRLVAIYRRLCPASSPTRDGRRGEG